jgi:hypothetical protein
MPKKRRRACLYFESNELSATVPSPRRILNLSQLIVNAHVFQGADLNSQNSDLRVADDRFGGSSSVS